MSIYVYCVCCKNKVNTETNKNCHQKLSSYIATILRPIIFTLIYNMDVCKNGNVIYWQLGNRIKSLRKKILPKKSL